MVPFTWFKEEVIANIFTRDLKKILNFSFWSRRKYGKARLLRPVTDKWPKKKYGYWHYNERKN